MGKAGPGMSGGGHAGGNQNCYLVEVLTAGINEILDRDGVSPHIAPVAGSMMKNPIGKTGNKMAFPIHQAFNVGLIFN